MKLHYIKRLLSIFAPVLLEMESNEDIPEQQLTSNHLEQLSSDTFSTDVQQLFRGQNYRKISVLSFFVYFLLFLSFVSGVASLLLYDSPGYEPIAQIGLTIILEICCLKLKWKIPKARLCQMLCRFSKT